MEVSITPDAHEERLLDALAEARHRDDPDALGVVGHLPNVVRDAFARGLEVLAAEHGLVLRPASPSRGPSVLTERLATAQLRIPDDAVESIAVLDPNSIELRTRPGDSVALERRTLERLLAILDHEDARRR